MFRSGWLACASRRLSHSAFILSSLLILAAACLGQALSPMQAHPRDRVTRPIDDERRAVLYGNLHPLARPKYDRGAVMESYRMQHMILTLQPDAAQQQALDELVADQHDPSSPYYQRWLTPEQYGERFGISENDLTLVKGWLELHGLQIEEVTAGRRAIIFSGTAGQVVSAFHTQIHSYEVNGALHHANVSDPQIPKALAAVVGGVVSLHDFRSEPLHRMASAVQPQFTAGGNVHYLTPGDFATIYDLAPLYQQSVNGSGQSVAIVARSNINIADVRQFRSAFGLPANDPQIIVNGTDPGTSNVNEEVEADLDVEWAGAVAKNAAVKFVTSASTNSSDGVYLSAQYIVNHNLAPVMSTSFGLCEVALGASGNSFINSLWQQAAAEGITVFVSSGDNGAAGCDSSSATKATAGLGVNGLCSTPYSVCVGGTQLNEGSNSSLYWAASNAAGTQASALSYIPETTWNESGGSGLWSSGGGASIMYAKPSWQTGSGVPADAKRDVPDVSLTAAGHDGYLIYMNGGLYSVGGTSASSPSLASLMALVVQKAAARQGNANTAFYTLATRQGSGGAAVFHDITTGNNSVPGLTGFNATAGYDRATGLGSVDASVLVNHWSDALVTPTFQLTAPGSSTALTQGANISSSWTVSVSGGFSAAVTFSITGLPSGVTATFTPATLNAPGSGTSTLKLTAATTAPVGTYSATVRATSGSTSKTASFSIQVTGPPTFSVTPSQPTASVAPGASQNVSLTTSAQSGFKAAVSFSVSGLPTAMTAKFTPASLASPGSGTVTLTLTAGITMVPGTYSIVATAAGGGVTQRTTLSVNVPGFTLTANATSATVASGRNAVVTLTTRSSGGFNSPVSFSASGIPTSVRASWSAASIAAPGNGSATLTLTRITGGSTGTFTVTLTASAGSYKQTAVVKLTVSTQSATAPKSRRPGAPDSAKAYTDSSRKMLR